MSDRRIKALRSLVDRGSTPGERNAARRALEVHSADDTRQSKDVGFDISFDDIDAFRRVAQSFVDVAEAMKNIRWPASASGDAVTTKAWTSPFSMDKVVIRVSTFAEMHQRFAANRPGGLTFMWRGEVHRSKCISGWYHDDSLARFCVVSLMTDLERV